MAELREDLSGKLQHLQKQLAIATEEVAAIHLRRLLDAIHQVARLKIKAELPAAEAIVAGLQAVVAPLPPSVAGGIARARHAWRHDDGTFMSYDDEQRIQLEQHERMARGGRARAAGAKRAPDGTFL